MELGLQNKVVAITGGATGIGLAAAQAFAAEGCQVALCGRSAGKLADAAAACAGHGFEIFTQTADVADNASLRAFAAATAQACGGIDIWINNAGINNPMPFEQMSEDAWHRLVDINFKGVYYGSAIAADYMKQRGGGVIINTSSFTALIPTAGKALYSATKAAVDSLTRTLAVELACHRIRVLSIIPGYTVTELTRQNVDKHFDQLVAQIAANRLATPDDMVGAYLFLASDLAAGYISGISLPVAGAKLATQNPLWSWKGGA